MYEEYTVELANKLLAVNNNSGIEAFARFYNLDQDECRAAYIHLARALTAAANGDSQRFDDIANAYLQGVRPVSVMGRITLSVAPCSIAGMWVGIVNALSHETSYIGICKNCGKPFFAEKARNHKREFCNNGDKCKMAYYNKKYAEKRKEQKFASAAHHPVV